MNLTFSRHLLPLELFAGTCLYAIVFSPYITLQHGFYNLPFADEKIEACPQSQKMEDAEQDIKPGIRKKMFSIKTQQIF